MSHDDYICLVTVLKSGNSLLGLYRNLEFCPFNEMPLKLDQSDMAILRQLCKDARLSYREIAKRVGLSTPTVESHISKMTEAGIILGFVPVLQTDKVCRSTSALLVLHVELPVIEAFSDKLSKLEEVRSIFHITGQGNLFVRLFLPESNDLEKFISKNIAGTEGVRIVSSQMITQTVKDEPGALLSEEFSVNLKCDYCGREILTANAIVMNVEGGKRFLCCTSCEQLYRAKYVEKKPVGQPFA